MLSAEPLGIPGAPIETLRALQAHLAHTDLSAATFVFLTDTQGHRGEARYALFVEHPQGDVITVDAFGGRYGQTGREALRELARWAIEHGVTRVRETIVNTYDFNRVAREPDQDELNRVSIASNPSDLNIYL